MFRRLTLMISLVAAMGVSVVIANSTAQKEKAKSKDQAETKEQKEKEKDKESAFFDSGGLVALELGGGAGGYLGVYLEEVTADRMKELGLKEERGAVVMKVVGDGPAEKAGLKENDVIVSFNGRRIDSVRELQRLLNETPPERTVAIEFMRGGSRQTISTTLAKRSVHGFQMLGPELNGQFMKQNEEALKKTEESLKLYEEAQRLQQDKLKDFGNFTFVDQGDFAFFGGTRLGITAESLTPQLAEFFGVKDGKGVLVASVAENGAAAKAGIKAGDVIIAVDNERVDSGRALMKALSGKTEGAVPFKVVRNHAEQTINVTLEKRELPAPRRRAQV